MTRRPVIGVDLGGTKVQAGVVTAGGDVLGEARMPTQADRPAEDVLANIVAAVDGALDQAGLSRSETGDLGLGSPGPLDIQTGVLISPGNLPTMHGFPLAARLREALGKAVVVNNDANCCGLGEARFGAGVGAEIVCGLTLGTGLGGFLVIGGQLYSGPRGAAVEIWCSPYCGDHVEEKVSGRGVARNYKKMTERTATAREVADLARAGDAAAREAWREFGRDLAVPIAYLCNVADADVCVLGGSMSAAWDLFSDTMFEQAAKYVNAVTHTALRIVPGRLGQSAGVLGAAALVLDAGAS